MTQEIDPRTTAQNNLLAAVLALRNVTGQAAAAGPIPMTHGDQVQRYIATGSKAEIARLLEIDGTPAPVTAAQAVRVPEWISVSERLPEDCQQVLVLCPDTGCEPAIWSAQWLAGSKTFESFSNGWADVDDISHWMPRPATPDTLAAEREST